MAATAKDVRAAHVPDELRRWADTFNSGVAVDDQDDEEEPEVDFDSDFEEVKEEEQNAGVAESETDGQMTATAHARVEEQIAGGGGAARHCDEDCNVQNQTQGGFLLGRKRKAIVTRSKQETAESEVHGNNGQEERISEDSYSQVGGGLQGRTKGATVTPGKLQMTTGAEIQNKNDQAPKKEGKGRQERGKQTQNQQKDRTTGPRKKARGCLRAENVMLRLQLVRKTKELEAEQIRRLELELQLKNKEIKSLKKQNEELRAENENYKKTAKPPRNPRLCRFCNEYVLGHDYRNCPKRREEDEDDVSS